MFKKRTILKILTLSAILFGAMNLSACGSKLETKSDPVTHDVNEIMHPKSDAEFYKEYKKRCLLTLDQPYITIGQLVKLQRRANHLARALKSEKYEDKCLDTFADMFSGKHIVDNINGHVYVVVIKTNVVGSNLDKYELANFDLIPVTTKQTSVIDRNWQKDHKE